jgi:hypothetical protein
MEVGDLYAFVVALAVKPFFFEKCYAIFEENVKR